MVQYQTEGLPGKDFDPTIHEFMPKPRGKEDGYCVNCGKSVSFHWHTATYGPPCGCQDCMPLETAKLSRPRAFFSRIINR